MNNPVVVFSMVVIQTLVLPASTQPVNRSHSNAPGALWRLRSSPDDVIRTRSMSQSTLMTGNHAGPLSNKNGASLAEVGVEVFLGLFVERPWTLPTTIRTTTESSAASATVNIETLPGYWLKDPSTRVQEPIGAAADIDYRTERYRLDDLFNKQNI